MHPFPTTLLLRGARVLDPSQNRDGLADIFIRDGKIAAVAPDIAEMADEVVDVSGLVATPGLVDLHVHFREPGREDRETIETASRAALAGGVTSAVAMPNVVPVADNQSVIEFVLKRAREVGLITIFPAGAITRREEGKMLAEMWELKRSGAVAVTDDGFDVEDEGVLLKAMEYGRTHDMLLMSHCDTATLTGAGVMHEGWESTKLGLPGIPEVAEDLAVIKNILLARRAGARLHLLHNSTEGAVNTIRNAKKRSRGKLTAEVSIQHAVLTDEECRGYNTNAKMYPPLRSAEHVQAVVAAIQDGTIDALTTDHAPHIEPDKIKPFADAAFGTVGLETSFAAMYTHLVLPGHISLAEGVALMTYKPAAIIGSHKGTLVVGADADISLFDLSKQWTVNPEYFYSKGKNSVFSGKHLTSKAVHTVVNGQMRMRDGKVL